MKTTTKHKRLCNALTTMKLLVDRLVKVNSLGPKTMVQHIVRNTQTTLMIIQTSVTLYSTIVRHTHIKGLLCGLL